MKKNLRLTESDLIRIVKRVVKESKINESEDDCENLFYLMEDIFQDFMDLVKISPKEENLEDIYDDLQSELGKILYHADDMECENYSDLELIYNDYLEDFREYVGLEY